MRPIEKLYLKTFLYTAIPYALFMLVFDLLDGDGFSSWKFLYMSLFFGAAMSLILVSFHKNRLKKIGIQEISTENLSVNQTRKIRSTLNKKELIERLRTHLIIGEMSMQEIENGILLSSGMSWKSWGEEIKIILNTTTNKEFEYEVSSRPKLKTILVDYGKNIENVIRIEQAIKTIAEQKLRDN